MKFEAGEKTIAHPEPRERAEKIGSEVPISHAQVKALMATKKEREARLTLQEGFDGSELHERSRQIPGTTRKQVTIIRSMPGTFENRYGRGEPGSMLDMLYQAGTEFARLCERCGHNAPGTVDFSRAGTTAWKGLPPARMLALDQHKIMVQQLGKLVTARLQRYAVEGKTTRQIARNYRRSEREMRAILDSDLARAAVYFGYAPRR